MVTSHVQTLLGAVRRALWRAQFAAAVRLALWGSAGLMLLAVAVHLAARAAPVGALLWALAVLWASMMVWAAWRRPAATDCALWADRHLGGASAFTTWLDVDRGLPNAANPAAVQWLEQWAATRVPDGLRRLAERPPSERPARALLSMLVCAALATWVLLLPDLAPPSTRQAAAPASGTVDRAMPVADAPEATRLVSEIASALRSAQPSDAPARGQTGRAPAAGPVVAEDGDGPAATNARATPRGTLATAVKSSAETPADASAAAGTAPSSGTGSGREAGDSRDQRADVGTSKVLQGALPVQRSVAGARRQSPQRQADMDRLGSYDEDLAPQGAAGLHTAAASPAATPPAGTEALRLSPTESGYVQAWLKASARNR